MLKVKRGLVGEGITEVLLWVVFLILAGIGVWFLVRQLTG